MCDWQGGPNELHNLHRPATKEELREHGEAQKAADRSENFHAWVSNYPSVDEDEWTLLDLEEAWHARDAEFAALNAANRALREMVEKMVALAHSDESSRVQYATWYTLIDEAEELLAPRVSAPTEEIGNQGEAAELGCTDCGRPYPHGLDMVLTRKQWLMIYPEYHGVLCPSCIVNRAEKLGAMSVHAVILFHGDAESEYINNLRLENADYAAENGQLKHELKTSALRDCPPDATEPVDLSKATKAYMNLVGKCTNAPTELPARPKPRTWKDEFGHPIFDYYDAAVMDDYLEAVLAALSHAQERLAGKSEKGGGNG